MWFKKCFYFGCLFFPILVVDGDSIEQNENFNKHLSSDLMKNITEVNKTLKDLIKNLKKMYKSKENLHSEASGSEIDEGFKENKQKVMKRNRSQKDISSTIIPSGIYEGTAYVFESINSDEVQSGDKKDPIQNFEIGQKKERTAEKINSGSKSASSSKEFKEISENEGEIEIEMSKESEQTTKKPKLKGQKTRFNILNTAQKYISSNESETLLQVRNQRIVYSEKFSPRTIWQDVVNKPIKLKRVVSKETGNLSDMDEDTDVDLENHKKVDDTNEKNYNQSLNASEGLFHRSYGDSCLAMPVKKCKKVMKIVNKNVCKVRFKCKSEFKSDFVTNYNRGCEKQYLYNVKDSEEDTTKVVTGDNQDDVYVDDNVNIIREKNDETELKPDTRNANLYPSANKQFVTIVRNGIKNSSLPHLSLRDKYERQCKKELRAKCIGAGDYAIKKTCSKHECDKKKEKALEKACKQECKQAFVLDEKTKASSDGSSESGSESDE